MVYGHSLGHAGKPTAAECLNQSQRCDECYDTLADSLVNVRNNKYNLRRVFYPLERASPVFVTVTYQYNDSSEEEGYLLPTIARKITC